MLWSREALVAATKGEAVGDWSAVTGVSIDTRTIKPGDLFVAHPVQQLFVGERDRGHRVGVAR